MEKLRDSSSTCARTVAQQPGFTLISLILMRKYAPPFQYTRADPHRYSFSGQLPGSLRWRVCLHDAILCCAVCSDGGTALLLTPRTGIYKPASGRLAARYRRTAAGDEAAQTSPTVSPFYPAVQDSVISPPRFRRCPRRPMSVVSRSYL